MAATLGSSPLVLAVDGSAILAWDALVSGLSKALTERGVPVSTLDTRSHFEPWPEIVRRTSSAELADDAVFARLATGCLADLFDAFPQVARPAEGVQLVFGPGAALAEHDVLWYADLPKRFAEAAIGAGSSLNLGQPQGSRPGSSRRLFYIDWPLLDRHRDTIAPTVDLWIDTQDLDYPSSLDGVSLRATLASLAARPFRTRPTFNTTPWGGHWAQRKLGFNPAAPNTALGYELIAPESGVLLGRDGGPTVEVPFQLIIALHAPCVLGERVYAMFGTSFPIRFDYLDTVDGGNLSVHCHPRTDYMRTLFGWPYTQHETYYMMVGGEHGKVFLGLREGVDVDAFRASAYRADAQAQPFDIEHYVQTFPADAHRLFLIPAGTPHGSGAGNVVLEVSATPYLYSLRFYDWLRRDRHGNQRPVHVDHAFRNLDIERIGAAVTRELLPIPRTLRRGSGWQEEVLGALPEVFFEVRRLAIDAGHAAPDDTSAGFHVLNVVEGDGVLIDTAVGHRHVLAYAETLVVPAAVGAYSLKALGRRRARVVKALVR
jgi:mannose-6-phosphate isomerase class I